MLVMVVFFIAFRWIHLSTPLIRLFLLVLILLLMPTLNFLPLWFTFFFQAEDGIRDRDVTGVQTCALPISIAQKRLGIILGDLVLLPHGIEILPGYGQRHDFGLAAAGRHFCAIARETVFRGQMQDRKSVRVGKECGARRARQQM